MIVTDVKRIVCSPQQLVANFMTFVAIVTLDADGLFEELVKQTAGRWLSRGRRRAVAFHLVS